MTVYPRRGSPIFSYDFWNRGQRYVGSTEQTQRDDAELVESKVNLRLRQEAGGVAAIDAARSPKIWEWADVYYAHAEKTLDRPDRVEDLLRVVLRFWGARPADDNTDNPPIDGEPYHDLHLLDPILDLDWITRFQEWIAARGRRRTNTARR